MRDKIKKVLMAATALAALALGGSAIAGAVSGDGGTATQQSSTGADDGTSDDAGTSDGRSDEDKRGVGGQRSDETLLTGDTAARVQQAALAETGGGTIERVETDADGNAAYEAHMVKEDGTRVTVFVDEQFDVVSIEDFDGPGDHARDGDEQSDDSGNEENTGGDSTAA